VVTVGEAWSQASSTTGLDQLNPGPGMEFGFLLIGLEIVWWLAVAYAAKRAVNTLLPRESESAT
jgi:hypothetical protein